MSRYAKDVLESLTVEEGIVLKCLERVLPEDFTWVRAIWDDLSIRIDYLVPTNSTVLSTKT